MGWSVLRSTFFYRVFVLAIGLAAGCGGDGNGGTGGSAGSGGSGGSHALAGTWEGHLIPLYQGLTLTIDASGEITEILANGSPFPDLQGGEVDDGPDIYTMTWVHDLLGPIAVPFLTDEGEAHGAIALLLGTEALIGALERDGSPTTNFFQPDVIGSWSGYGYAYDQDVLDFAPFSPVTAEATSGTPIGFSVTMPSGTITGVLPDFVNILAFWGGTAAVSGASVGAVMSPDKQFIAVQAVPVGSTTLEDRTFFALNREP